MASYKALIASLLLSLLVLQLVHALKPETTTNQVSGSTGDASDTKVDCGAACAVRCSETKRPNLCKRACGTCCSKCNCVPPGTFGNYEACPCYASLTTKNQMHKCP